MEMKVLRWMAGNTRMDRIRNLDLESDSASLRLQTSVANPSFNGTAILWTTYNIVCKIGFDLEIQKKRAKGRSNAGWRRIST